MTTRILLTIASLSGILLFVPQSAVSLPTATVYNIEYGRNVNSNPLLLDAYTATSPNSPVIVVIHGGGWDSGDKLKKGIPQVCNEAVIRGYLCFAVNFTLSGEAPWPAQLDDLRQAIAWVQANAGTYNGDGTKVAAWGLSSGAQLGLVLAYRSVDVDLVVSWSAPADLVAEAGRKGVMKLLGCTTPCPDKAAEASPVHVAHSAAPPTYIGHSTGDTIVPIWHAERLRDQLQSLGVPFLYVISEKGHGKGLWVSQRNQTFAWLNEQLASLGAP